MDEANASQLNMIKRSDYYVYLYRDPSDNKIFYIGKGCGDRVYAHLNADGDSKKAQKIKEIQKAGRQPILEYLREGLDEKIALDFEAIAIDVIGIDELTNQIHGHSSKMKRVKTNLNKMKLEELKDFIDPDEAIITEPSILIRINQLYRYGMDADSLYDATRGVWRVGPQRECAEYAFSVFKGVVMEVYKIKHPWHLAGTKAIPLYKTRPEKNELLIYDPSRWEFEGDVAESEIREKYLKKSVKHYLTANSQNPIKYVKCEQNTARAEDAS